MPAVWKRATGDVGFRPLMKEGAFAVFSGFSMAITFTGRPSCERWG